MAFFARNGGFLFPERWLFIFVIGGFFHPDYAYFKRIPLGAPTSGEGKGVHAYRHPIQSEA